MLLGWRSIAFSESLITDSKAESFRKAMARLVYRAGLEVS